MASSSSSASKSDDRQHYQDREAAQKKQNGESSSSSRSKQIKYIPFVVVGIIVVMSAAMGTIWAVVKPKRPVYAIEYATIANASTPNPASLTGEVSFVMRAYNPNKKSTIYYESMNIYNATDSGNETAISVWLVKNFSQPPFNVTRIRFVLPVQTSIGPGDSAIEYLQHGRVNVNISVQAKMRFEYGWWKFMPRTIGIYCQPAAVMLGNNFQSTDCYVNL